MKNNSQKSNPSSRRDTANPLKLDKDLLLQARAATQELIDLNVPGQAKLQKQMGMLNSLIKQPKTPSLPRLKSRPPAKTP